MPISLDPRARYVTQSSAYTRLLDNGPLTDRKIAKYRKLGFYGPVATAARAVKRRLAKPSLTKRYGL